jgi:hypothetical protein
MELDDLKYQLSRKIGSDQSRSDMDISRILKKEPGSIIQKIKKSLLIELAFAIIFTLASLVVILLSPVWSIRIYFSVFIFLGGAFAAILSILLKRTNSVHNHTKNIKENLQGYLSLLKEFVKRYFQFTMILLPVCFAFSVWLAYSDFGAHKPFRWDVFSYLLIYLVCLGAGLYYFTRWYLEKLYGRYIRELQASLKELDE